MKRHSIKEPSTHMFIVNYEGKVNTHCSFCQHPIIKPMINKDNESSCFELCKEIFKSNTCNFSDLINLIDILLNNIHNETVELHKNIPIQVKNKSTYNSWMDDISIGIYPNTILIMTSNVDPIIIDELDPSYLNQNRIDLRIKSERKH